MKIKHLFDTLYEEVSQDVIDDMINILDDFGEQFDTLPISVKKAINALSSLGQVLDNDAEVTTSMLNQVKPIIEEFESSVVELLAEQDDIQDARYDDILNDFDKQMQTLDVKDTDFSTQIKSKLARDIKKAKHKLLSELPTDELFKVVQLDTIPIVHRKLNAPKLRALGISIREFNDYFIFEDQRVLAINIEYLKQVNEGIPKKRQVDAYTLATSLLNENYNLMSIFSDEPIRIKGTSHLYFWLMPTAIMANVVKLVGVMDEWGINS